MSSMSGHEDELLRLSLSPPGASDRSVSSADFQRHKAAGNAAFSRGDYVEALAHYAAAADADPFSAVPAANRVMVLLRMREWESAEREAGVALALMGEGERRLRVKVLLRRATAREGLRKLDEARSDLDLVERIDRGNVEARAIRERLSSRGIHFVGEVEDSGVMNGTVANGRGANRRMPGGRIVNGRAGGNVSLRRGGTGSYPNSGRRTIDPEESGLDVREAVSEVRNRLVEQRPSNFSEFDSVWRSVRGDPETRGRYLVMTVGKEGIESGLLGESLTAQLLMDVVAALDAFLQRSDSGSPSRIAEVLTAFRDISRFELVVMFLERSEKDSLKALIHLLIDRDCGTELEGKLRALLSSV